jgi:RimJ/RimL family protein N-acetyltransferase
MKIAVINCGSSSIKYEVFDARDCLMIATGLIEKIGSADARLWQQRLKAEVAFLIDDSYQGVGIGSRIFKHLAVIARAAGTVKFEAEILPSNEGMLRLFTRSGLPMSRTAFRDSIHVTIELNTPHVPVNSESPHDTGGKT